MGQHIRIDIVLRVLPPRVGWLLEWVGDVLGLVCCLYFVWYGIGVTSASYSSGAISMKTLILPEWWLLWPMPVAFVLLAIEFVFRMRRLAHVRAASARRRGFGVLGSSRHVLADGLAAAARRLDRAAVHRHAGGVLVHRHQSRSARSLFLGGDAGLHQLVRNSGAAVVNFSLTPIPLFILMGEVLFHTGLAIKVIDGVERLIRQVPGRLAVVAVVAGTVFSAISGSTIATTAMLGSLMLPVMLARGYHPTMATGPIMAIGAVDMLIPPSALTVLLGSLSGISISKLLIGGVVPGLMLSAAFVGYIIVRVRANPALAPPTPIEERTGWAKYELLVLYVMPLISIFVVVIGAMSGGIATPTESAALGALATMALALIYRALTRRRAAQGAARHRRHLGDDPVHHPRRHHVLADPQLLRRDRGHRHQRFMGQGLSPFAVLAGMMLLLIFLGIFVDQVSMMLITLPVFMPIVQRLDIDLIWFGVLYLICMQLGLLLPPHGLLLMTMKGVAPPQVTMAHIFRAVVPYVGMSLILLVLLILFPAVATWLPALLG